MDKNSVVIAGMRGRREVEEGIGRLFGDGWRPDLGSEHTIQCTDDVLWNYAPETYIILLTSVTSINSIKEIKKMRCNFKN